jgi:hypothetical protein
MKKLIPVFSLISFLCFAGSAFIEKAYASKCDAKTVKELRDKKDSLKDERDNLERKILDVKREIRKCDKEKRSEEMLNKSKTSKEPM